MADDIEIDVEGDFDIKLELNGDIAYDVNELPSKSADLLPEFTHPPWMLEQGWTLDSCMDEKSKATIEKMLQEEQYYLTGKNSTRVTFEKSPKSTKCKPATNKRLWTKEEKKLFEQGLELYGRSWKKIAEIIPGRTSLQVKNYAQNYFKSLSKQNTEVIHPLSEPVINVNLENPLLSVLATVTTAQPTFPAVTPKELPPIARKQNPKDSSVTSTITNNNIDNTVIAPCLSDLNTLMSVDNEQKTGGSSESENEDLLVDIEGIDNDENNPVLKNRSASPNSVYIALLQSSNIRKEKAESISRSARASCTRIEEPSVKPLQSGNVPDVTRIKTLSSSSDGISTNQDITLEEYANTSEEETNSCINASILLNEEPIHSSDTDEIANVFYTSGGNIFSYPIPKEEKYLEPNKITEEENSLFPEFFEGRIAKTPDRFLKIRNYILDCWKNCKPAYLNKTSVRPGLKNCGDVNYFGKIHAYLECTGAINVGCEQASYNQSHKPLTLSSKKEATNADHQSQQKTKMEAMRPRRRRIRNADGFWVSEKQAEGRTIEHKVNQSAKANRSKVVHKIDPFRLIPCQTFKKGMEPFQLEIESSALIVMDVHAHMFKTEVVGLLGGECSPDNSYLRIKSAVPCRSISTRIQCEMDAVSQAEASAVIAEADQWVVGWYHSHPSFAANPSVRDVESQLKYQEWFARGGAKYVAFIVSPYMGKGNSEVCCLTVEKLANSQYMPFQHNYQELNSELDAEHCLANIKQLLSQNFCHFENRVYMNKLVDSSSELTCLTKMINSISNYITSDHPDKAHFLASMEELFTRSHRLQNSSKSQSIMNQSEIETFPETTSAEI